MRQTRRIIVSGLVQGVFFRKFTKQAADAVGLKGTVRNLRNGNVEIIVQGDSERIDHMIKWCWQGSPYSKVTGVEVSETSKMVFYTSFQITY